MKIGTRSEGHARCFIGICKALPKKIRYSIRELSSLKVPEEHRKQGHASALVSKVLAEAEKQSMVVVVIPSPFGEGHMLSQAQLSQWYRDKFGFERIQYNPEILAKAPMKYLNQFKLKSENISEVCGAGHE